MAGWNKSLVHRWNFWLEQLVSELKKPPTPEGKTGALRRGFILSRDRGVSTIKDASGNPIGIRVINEVPYARIRDIGGRIPDRRPVRARFMHWMAPDGPVFTRFARGYNIKPLNYVKAAVDRFLFNSRNITIKWN